MSATKTVKVTKSGNSRVLPLPAEFARDAGVDVGDTYAVEVRGSDIIYHRDVDGTRFLGEGRSRVGIVPEGRAVRMPGRSGLGVLDDWDF
jgi:hypothetical protein